MNCIVNKINENMKHIAILKQPFFNMVLSNGAGWIVLKQNLLH